MRVTVLTSPPVSELLTECNGVGTALCCFRRLGVHGGEQQGPRDKACFGTTALLAVMEARIKGAGKTRGWMGL